MEQSTTPMLRQYQDIKSRHQDSILFFRLGDFYEMFFDDAKEASSLLDLVLTSRGQDIKGKIPMCGIPYHSADNYIAKLIKAGKKVAICEQTEDVAVAKGIVKRDVVRIITAGTYLDEATDSRFVCTLIASGETFGVALIDSSGGTILANELSGLQTVELMAKYPVYECVFPEAQEEHIVQWLNHPLLKSKQICRSPFGDWAFNRDAAYKNLLNHFDVHSLKGFGVDGLNVAISACGALIEYLKTVSKTPLKHIDKISLYAHSNYVFISPAAHYGLEMESLLKTLDHTQTAMGRRLFRFWLYHPLKDVAAIKSRQDAIRFLHEQQRVQESLGECLKNLPDLEKALSRISSGCSTIKDVLAIRQGLLRAPLLKEIIAQARHADLLNIDDVVSLRETITRTINPDVPLAKPEGRIVCTGIDQELDELRNILENGKQWLAAYQTSEVQKTGINSLKVGFNNVFGFYIEISKANQKNVPVNYVRKQTLVNGERYITQELKEYEEKFLTAQDKILTIERRILAAVERDILDQSIALHKLCGQIATIDCVHALSVVAGWHNYIFPSLDESTVLDIKDGRHPVVEKTVTADFVANDTLLDTDQSHLIILTGPNMAGKSTYIRQTAILVIMSQMGAPIPAQRATIGIVDKIFTRIGAHDAIAQGQSTFMVEMTETADILNNLTARSLVILDEIGRGTSTSDGLSLAWALAEYMQAQKVRTLFATHFHELVALADKFSGVKNFNVAVKEWKDKIIFMHKIVPGGSDDSYGIYVAKLAGIPDKVIHRSKEILSELELGSITPTANTNKQLNLFTPSVDTASTEVREALEAIDINTLTPIDALNKLQELKRKLF